jgi:hypothetical protein
MFPKIGVGDRAAEISRRQLSFISANFSITI